MLLQKQKKYFKLTKITIFKWSMHQYVLPIPIKFPVINIPDVHAPLITKALKKIGSWFTQNNSLVQPLVQLPGVDVIPQVQLGAVPSQAGTIALEVPPQLAADIMPEFNSFLITAQKVARQARVSARLENTTIGLVGILPSAYNVVL